MGGKWKWEGWHKVNKADGGIIVWSLWNEALGCWILVAKPLLTPTLPGQAPTRSDIAPCWNRYVLLLFLVSVSEGFQNKLPQTGWPKTTKMHSLTVLEAKLESKCQQGHVPSKSSGENPSLPLLVSVSCWQALVFLTCKCIILISSIFTYLFPLYVHVHFFLIL